MPSSKLLLTIATGGVLLGALMGQMADPKMKFADESDLRRHHEREFSATPMQLVDAGPEDLSPSGWFGPTYAQPAVFAPQYAPIPDYAPPTADDGYSSIDAPGPDVSPEVDQASLDAAAAAAALAEDSSANSPRSASALSQARPGTAPSDLAPDDKHS